MKTLIIIPAYGEAPVIGEVIQEVMKARPDVDLVVIDDCSPDDTGAKALAAGARVIRLPVNLGIGGAVQTGFKYAVREGYDAVVQVDGDGQHDPHELAKVLDPLEKGEADMVIGSRFLEKTDYKAPFARRVGMILFSTVARLAMKQTVADTTSGFRSLNRPLFSYLAEHYPVDFPDAETLVLVRRAKFRIKEVSVDMRPRKSGKSSTTTLKSIYYPFKQLLSILVVMLRTPPPRMDT
ncbi:MAG: glycosyltransferase family 2 protein [Candidatus Eisenbacteria bacterium]|uniref:Glycosyltransferase family 2 protein n=1 Tax=Eiseniibacteriota bacterium TaxID=2212470 RepID=A0A7Y2H1Y6_UNCEI|nr:glycosyltransferase family 2 protein [Candidatus Eisenbacteria bacterium]